MCALMVGGGDSLVNTYTRARARTHTLSLLNSCFGVTVKTKGWSWNVRACVRKSEWACFRSYVRPWKQRVDVITNILWKIRSSDSPRVPAETLAVVIWP